MILPSPLALMRQDARQPAFNPVRFESPAPAAVFYRVAQSCGFVFRGPRERPSLVPARLNLAESPAFSKATIRFFAR
jgi:hypothetical protein